MCSDKKIVFPVHPLKDWSRNLIAQSIQFSLEDMNLISSGHIPRSLLREKIIMLLLSA